MNLNKNQLLILKDTLSYLKTHKLNKDFLEDTLKELCPNLNNEPLINYVITEKGTIPAKFVPATKCISICVDKLIEWSIKNKESILFEMGVRDKDNTLKAYLLIYAIIHEIMHSYQYLIGKKIIESPSDVLTNAYKTLMDLLTPTPYILPHPIKQTRNSVSFILYLLKQDFYLLERNANIESATLLSSLAKEENNEDFFELFTKMKNMFLKIGYTNSNIGCIEETFRKILMYDKYKKFNHEVYLTEEEKIYYGFTINEYTRTRLLSSK